MTSKYLEWKTSIKSSKRGGAVMRCIRRLQAKPNEPPVSPKKYSIFKSKDKSDSCNNVSEKKSFFSFGSGFSINKSSLSLSQSKQKLTEVSSKFKGFVRSKSLKSMSDRNSNFLSFKSPKKRTTSVSKFYTDTSLSKTSTKCFSLEAINEIPKEELRKSYSLTDCLEDFNLYNSKSSDSLYYKKINRLLDPCNKPLEKQKNISKSTSILSNTKVSSSKTSLTHHRTESYPPTEDYLEMKNQQQINHCIELYLSMVKNDPEVLFKDKIESSCRVNNSQKPPIKPQNSMNHIIGRIDVPPDDDYYPPKRPPRKIVNRNISRNVFNNCSVSEKNLEFNTIRTENNISSKKNPVIITETYI